MEVGELLAAGRTSDVHAFGRTEVVKVPHPDTPAHWAGIEADLCDAVHQRDGRRCAVRSAVTTQRATE